jgi:cell division septation protein DedD
MDRVSSYRIPAEPAILRAAATAGELPAALVEPLQALVTGISRRTAEGPVAIYLCADDESFQLRDDVAFLLVRALSAHVPSALLVDCDFLHVGLHGLVPQKDALGFLDFLLYGSSIGVITQEARGVRVVGAGSFPVTRRMPFVETAFSEAARRLAAHARCAVFVGPLCDEHGNPHPLTGEVDTVAVVVSGERSQALEVADRIAEKAHDVWTIHLGGAPAPAHRSVEKPASAPTVAAAPAPPRLPTGVPPEPVRAAAPEPRYASLAPRIAIIVFGIVVIAFAAWWFTQDRDADIASTDETPATETGAVSGGAEPANGPAAFDTTATAVAETTGVADDSVRLVIAPPVNPADTGGRTGGTQLISPADIHVMEDLEARWKDWYMIHISSFQESIRAREEVDFLQSREFPVFIVFLDLGPKGKWYRVYSGPFRTREEAREVKKNLDAVPQVRFTRITQIPE